MDGLLVDSEPLWLRVEHALVARHGGAWSAELARRCIGTGLPRTVEIMRAVGGIAIGVEEGVRELVRGFLERAGELALKPGASELCARAAQAGLPLALASSSSRVLVDAVLERFRLGDRFAAVLTGDDVARPKPAPDLFLAASARLGVPPSWCVVLEDSLAGVEAARAAGIPVIAVPEADAALFRALTPHVVRDLYEAAAILSFEGTRNTRRQEG
jgi:HAD superfamily hydrolase (TIGR01509 family)